MYDLHTHSSCSDGAYTPAELVRQAAAAGVRVLALSDHDTTDGLAEARHEAGLQGIDLISAVEISTSWRGHTIHVIGLQIDEQAPVLRTGLTGIQAIRAERAIEIGQRLARAGFPGAYEAALVLAGSGMLTRTHFAQHIVQCGRARSVKQVFERFMTPGKPGYVPTEWATIPDAVSWIRQSGGVAVLAHPQRYKLSATARGALIDEFKELGGAALEVIAGTGHPPDIQANATQARRSGLAVSVGSDFHSPENSWLKLGRLPPLPADLLPVWEVWSTTRLDGAVS